MIDQNAAFTAYGAALRAFEHDPTPANADRFRKSARLFFRAFAEGDDALFDDCMRLIEQRIADCRSGLARSGSLAQDLADDEARQLRNATAALGDRIARLMP